VQIDSAGNMSVEIHVGRIAILRLLRLVLPRQLPPGGGSTGVVQ
jgi:hypothetical protein